MTPTAIALLRFKIYKLLATARIVYYQVLGMKINKTVKIGKLHCHWPNKVSIGNDCTLEDMVSLRITHPFSAHNYISIGNRVFLGYGCEIKADTSVTIGNDCLIASNTTIVDTGHEAKRDLKINLQPVTSKDITIGDDVWIGTQCVILAGVTIGNGSIIGAGSLVNKSIPENEIWAGTPARFIKNR